MKILVTCEHGGTVVPNDLNRFLKIPELILKSHRGYDPGALACAEYAAKHMTANIITNKISRLVIDFNRSENHKELFSEYSKNLQEYQKQNLLQYHYLPYRKQAEEFIEKSLKTKQQILHLSFHSFTPELDGTVREADIGILFDPKRKEEKTFSENLKKEIGTVDNTLRVRLNYPYSGKSDGLTTYFRSKYKTNYSGIEIEYNQSMLSNKNMVKSVTDKITNFVKSLP